MIYLDKRVVVNGRHNSAKLGIYEKSLTSFPYIVANRGNGTARLLFDASDIKLTYTGPSDATSITIGEKNIVISVNYNGVAHSLSVDQVVNKIKIQTGSATYYLPTIDGSAGDSLRTDGSGILYWG